MSFFSSWFWFSRRVTASCRRTRSVSLFRSRSWSSFSLLWRSFLFCSSRVFCLRRCIERFETFGASSSSSDMVDGSLRGLLSGSAGVLDPPVAGVGLPPPAAWPSLSSGRSRLRPEVPPSWTAWAGGMPVTSDPPPVVCCSLSAGCSLPVSPPENLGTGGGGDRPRPVWSLSGSSSLSPSCWSGGSP